jgi:hypothetical protein
MSLKKKRRDFFKEEYEDLLEVQKLGSFLTKLSIPEADDLVREAEDEHCDTFCCECERYIERCNCGEHRYERDYDYDDYDYEVKTDGCKPSE